MLDYTLEFVLSPMPKLKHPKIDMDFLPVYDPDFDTCEQEKAA